MDTKLENLHLICNPIAGRGQAIKTLNIIKEWLKYQSNLTIQIHLTEKIGHATSLTKEITSQNQMVTIFVLGGDGTISEVLNGINNFNNTQLAILPYGSGNDFFRVLGIKEKNPVTLINSYLHHSKVREVDYLLLNDKYRVINSVDFGMPADTIVCRNKMHHFSPITQYKIAIFKKGLFWKTFSCQFLVDKKPTELNKAVLISISNGQYIGGGALVNPDANIDDGFLSAVFVKKFNHLLTIHNMLKIKFNKTKKIKSYYHFKCKEVDLLFDDKVIEFDGNLLYHQSQANIKVIPKQLKILSVDEENK